MNGFPAAIIIVLLFLQTAFCHETNHFPLILYAGTSCWSPRDARAKNNSNFSQGGSGWVGKYNHITAWWSPCLNARTKETEHLTPFYQTRAPSWWTSLCTKPSQPSIKHSIHSGDTPTSSNTSSRLNITPHNKLLQSKPVGQHVSMKIKQSQ